MQETLVQSLGQEDPLEKEVATHSRSLAWEIAWTEEPGGLRAMGSQRVGHDWSSLAHVHCGLPLMLITKEERVNCNCLSFIPETYSFSEDLSEWVRSQDWTELILWERLREPNIKLKHQIAQILWGDVLGGSEPPLFFPSREFSADLALSQRASSK